MSRENPAWGAPRIHGELLKLGYFVSEATVARYMIKRRGRPTQNWKTFLDNPLRETCAIDFLAVPTVMFKTLYVFVVLSLDRRRIVHLNVTAHPNGEWTARQTHPGFPFDTAPRFLVRDRYRINSGQVEDALCLMGIEQKVISARSPWQNGYCERVVGTLKRECLNHVIVFNEATHDGCSSSTSSTTTDREPTSVAARTHRPPSRTARHLPGETAAASWWAA